MEKCSIRCRSKYSWVSAKLKKYDNRKLGNARLARSLLPLAGWVRDGRLSP